jgi:hypothetical protein
MKVKKGDKFICIRTVVMDDGEKSLQERFVHLSESDWI